MAKALEYNATVTERIVPVRRRIVAAPTRADRAFQALVIGAAAGLGNGSVFKIIPLVLTKEAGAAIGIVSCLGALGGFVPPLLLGWTMDHLGSPAWAYTGMALFALLCLFVNVWFYHRRTSPTHC